MLQERALESRLRGLPDHILLPTYYYAWTSLVSLNGGNKQKILIPSSVLAFDVDVTNCRHTYNMLSR